MLYKKIEQANLGNDDENESYYTQEAIQMACSDMKIEEIEREYGPIEVIRKLSEAVEDPAIFSQNLIKKPKNQEQE